MSKQWLIAGMAGLILAGCVKMPQSREEFRTAVSQGAFSAKAESFVVNRNFTRTVTHLKAKADACLNREVKRSMVQGLYQEHTRSIYRSSVQTPATNRAEFTMQVTHSPRGVGADAPPGGFFLMVADIEAVSPDSLRVNLYRPTLGHGAAVDAVRNWINGKDDGCPSLS
ncbi:MAG TPA: hypothetical protein VIE37_18940 [Methylomirabilota bacterium]|jgi:hypothetical protein